MSLILGSGHIITSNLDQWLPYMEGLELDQCLPYMEGSELDQCLPYMEGSELRIFHVGKSCSRCDDLIQ